VKDEKDIGLVIDEELYFDKHICEKVNKENSISAVLRRTFRNSCFLLMILHVSIISPLILLYTIVGILASLISQDSLDC
jgi:hypothetical protein